MGLEYCWFIVAHTEMKLQKTKDNSRRAGSNHRPFAYEANALPTKLRRLTFIPGVEHPFEHWFLLEPLVFATNCFEVDRSWGLLTAVSGEVCVSFFSKRQDFWEQTSQLTSWISKASFSLCFSQNNHAQHETSDQNKLCRSHSGGHLCDDQVCELKHCGREEILGGRQFGNIPVKSGTHFWCRSKLLVWCYFVADSQFVYVVVHFFSYMGGVSVRPL